MKLVWVSPQADRDLDRIADYYVEQGGAPLGLRFYAAVSQTFDRLADFPESSPRVTSDHSAIDGWRVAVVDPPFSRVLAYYLVGSETVDILRILDAARDPAAAFEHDD